MSCDIETNPDFNKRKTLHSGTVTVRPARAGDADYIRGLSKKVFEQYGPYESLLVQWFELGITVTLLALMEKHAVGFAMLRRLEHGWSLPRVSELLAIAVEPAKWRLGIGDLLMDEILKEAERLGVETLFLHTAIDNLPARILFRKHGFSEFGMKKKYYPKGQDAIMMYKDISRGD